MRRCHARAASTLARVSASAVRRPRCVMHVSVGCEPFCFLPLHGVRHSWARAGYLDTYVTHGHLSQTSLPPSAHARPRCLIPGVRVLLPASSQGYARSRSRWTRPARCGDPRRADRASRASPLRPTHRRTHTNVPTRGAKRRKLCSVDAAAAYTRCLRRQRVERAQPGPRQGNNPRCLADVGGGVHQSARHRQGEGRRAFPRSRAVRACCVGLGEPAREFRARCAGADGRAGGALGKSWEEDGGRREISVGRGRGLARG